MVDAASTYGTTNYAANMEQLADMENWMRVFAANHAAGNWDAYGAQNAQNLYGYIGTKGTKYSLLMFDFNIVLGNSGSWGPGAESLRWSMARIPTPRTSTTSPFFAACIGARCEELVNGPLDVRVSGPLLDAKYSAFQANGVTAENPNSALKNWLSVGPEQHRFATRRCERRFAFTVNCLGHRHQRCRLRHRHCAHEGADHLDQWRRIPGGLDQPHRPSGLPSHSGRATTPSRSWAEDRFGQALPGATGSASVELRRHPALHRWQCGD